MDFLPPRINLSTRFHTSAASPVHSSEKYMNPEHVFASPLMPRSSNSSCTTRRRRPCLARARKEWQALPQLKRSNAQGPSMIAQLPSFLSSTAEAKTARLTNSDVQKQTPVDNIATEKRMFVKHSLETRLVRFQPDTARPSSQSTPSSLKRLDDKMILTEVHLLESRVYRGICDFPKAKAALTSSRTAAKTASSLAHS
ncbi:hypothetical protein DFP72DRAFT_1064229 [Ephemerocybe angulata]|uniref:Uncharacterized protein n=1 Tax=Ephemerocybe angulata TaxID=980116 RepID=A0A8H6MAX3_9AGAR|nr:hypothetical protein DFP72DRAFT_1064229 [Tulosesus angulatus]